MVESLRTEEEQIEAIKAWFRENGSQLSIVFIIVLAFIVGWRYWNHHQTVKMENASLQYNLVLDALQSTTKDNDPDLQAKKLLEDYSKTPYAALTSLALAGNQAQKQDYAQALQHLNWVLLNSNDEVFRHIARLRIARIQLSQGQYDEALKALDVKETDGFTTLYDELKGDIYFAMKQLDKAREAYEAALKSSPKDIQRPVLTIKSEDIASEFKKGDAP